jgi:RsiW-degrading membrane proteinase PrsW (M82 family)
MDADLLLKALIAMAPVLLLLLVFDRLDVFNLIPMRDIGLLVIAGAALALFSYFANLSVLDGFPIGFTAYSRYVAPVVEESLKATPIIFLFARNRLGFKLDAAIAGFAVGTGFSMAENLWYLAELQDANITDWLVRGFGTAIMHGAATALFAVISHEWSEKQAESAATQYRFNPLLFVPGLVAAMVVHSIFNHLPAQPLLAMVLMLLLAPMTLFMTLARSERVTRQWLAADAAAHRQLLEDIRTGHFESKTGSDLRDHLRDLRAANAEDVLAYVELKTELVLRAEESILATHNGGAASMDETELAKFERLDALEKRLGKAVVAAISSRIGFSRNDLYELGRLRARLSQPKD